MQDWLSENKSYVLYFNELLMKSMTTRKPEVLRKFFGGLKVEAEMHGKITALLKEVLQMKQANLIEQAFRNDNGAVDIQTGNSLIWKEFDGVSAFQCNSDNS